MLLGLGMTRVKIQARVTRDSSWDTALIGLGMLGSRLGFRVRSIGVTGQYTVVNWPSYFTCDKWAY